MIGEIKVIDGVEYEVVWAGGDGLVANRETKSLGVWTAPPRLYTWSGKYKGKFKAKPKVDNQEKLDQAEEKIDFLGGD